MPFTIKNRFKLTKEEKLRFAKRAGVGIKSIERRISAGWPLERLGEPTKRTSQAKKPEDPIAKWSTAKWI